MSIRSIVARVFVSLLLVGGFSSPNWAQSLNNDAFVTAEITGTGQIDRYQFTASAGDIVYFNVADRDTTSLTPTVRLFDPLGTEVASEVDSFTASIFGLSLTESGLYRAIVQDSGADNLGFYTVHYALVPGANEGGRLPNDARIAGTLELGDIDTYTFDANAGDRIHLNVADRDGTGLTPVVILYGPDGTLVASDVDSFTATLRDIAIDADGVWTVVVSDSGSDNAGDYELFFARVPDANEKGLLPNDARRAASLALGDIDTWTFPAEEGDRLHLNISDVDVTSFTPDLLVYAPDGTLLFSDVDSFTATMNGVIAPATGLYTAVVKDSGADNAGDYELHFARAPGAMEGGTLAGFDVVAGTLELGDIDTFEIGAAENATFVVNVGDADNTSFTPAVIVYDENGDIVASAVDSFSANVSLRVETSGFYTVVVQDSGADNVGNYTLNFDYFGGAPPVRTRAVVLEPNDWYLLGVPADTGGTLGELFDGVLDPENYDVEDVEGGWILFAYDTGTLNTPRGAYRKLDLSEPVPQGTGFWLLHLAPTALRLNLPVSATDASGDMGGGCADGTSCITTPLATTPRGDWTIGAVPSTLSPGADTFRFVAETPDRDCADGCTLDEAADAGYSGPDGVWVYEPSTRNYRLLSGVDSVAPWTGFWLFATRESTPGSPALLLPVR